MEGLLVFGIIWSPMRNLSNLVGQSAPCSSFCQLLHSSTWHVQWLVALHPYSP